MRRVVLTLLVSSACSAQLYTITTVAGGAPFATPAKAVPAGISPLGLARDSAGNIYFTSGNCVFRVDRSGIMTRIAGNSRAGYAGDGGQAVNAQLNSPRGLALDPAGNLVIADTENYRIRKISAEGIITTIAGSGISGFAGDGGPAVNAQLGTADTIAIDSQGTLYVGDGNFAGVSNLPGLSYVRKVGLDGIISEVSAAKGMSGGAGVAVDSYDNLYVASAGPSVVVKISPSGTVVRVAGGGGTWPGDGGLATAALLIRPHRVMADADGNVYIGDYGQVPQGGYRPALRKVSPDGVITTIAGGGQIYDTTELQIYPSALVADGAHGVLVADQYGVVDFSPAMGIGAMTRTTIAGSDVRFTKPVGDGGRATNAPLDLMGSYNGGPQSVAVDREGNIFVAERSAGKVRKISAGGIISTFAGTGGFNSSGDGGPAALAEFVAPAGLWFDSSGNLYIWDSGNGTIRKVSPQGIISTALRSGPFLYAVNAVSVDSSGNVFLTDTRGFKIHKIAPDGVDTVVAGNGQQGDSGDGGSALNASLDDIQEVTSDSAGNLYLAANRRVRKVSVNGVITTARGTASFGRGIAVDGLGNVYSTVGNQVRRVSPNGALEILAGTDPYGYSGDNGPAVAARLANPYGLTVDPSGAIYVADLGNNSIRRLQPSNQFVMISGVVDAASEGSSPLSPGKIVAIYGAGFDPARTRIQIDGIAALVLYVTSTQIGAVVPYAVSGDTAVMTATTSGQPSVPFIVNMSAVSPSVFTSNLTGSGQAATVNLDGTLNTAASPVTVGSFISLYCTGEGQTSPAGADGKPASNPLPKPLLPVSVTVDGQPAVVQYAGGAPGQIAGLIQINVQIPLSVKAGGYVPVIVRVGDVPSQPGVTIAVRSASPR